MNRRRFAWIAGLGCTGLVLIVMVGLGGLLFFSTGAGDVFQTEGWRSAPTVDVADTVMPHAVGTSAPTPVPS